jgi:transposase
MLYFFKQNKNNVMAKTNQTTSLSLAMINPHTAGVDVGSTLMMVSYTDGSGNHYLMETDGFTESLKELAATLHKAQVTHVAMEATGVYWMALYEVLEGYGFEVTLINPRHFKNVAAQKTDVKDCQWIHQLHAHGLLRNSHIAPELFREMKSYLHERNILQQQKSDTLNRIHRTLTQMNIKVQHLISDMEGVAGMKLLRGMAEGVSDPPKLLSLINTGTLKASREDLLKSLDGLYKPHFIHILRHSLKAFDFFKDEMKNYESLLEDVLNRMLPPDEKGKVPIIEPKKGLVRKNQYGINIKSYMTNILGTDATAIDGLDEITVLEIVSVTGSDMGKWPTAEHFTSWLNLSPMPKRSGGKLLGHQKRHTNNVATQAFRLAAQTLWKQKGSLGNLYRRLSAQKGSKKAIKAVARKLAVIFYTIVKNSVPYDASKFHLNAEKQRAKKVARLLKEARSLGMILQSTIAA